VAPEGFGGTLTLASANTPTIRSICGDWRYDAIQGGLRRFTSTATGEVVRSTGIGAVTDDLRGLDTIDDNRPCLPAGTRIMTAPGEAPVGRLRADGLAAIRARTARRGYGAENPARLWLPSQ